MQLYVTDTWLPVMVQLLVNGEPVGEPVARQMLLTGDAAGEFRITFDTELQITAKPEHEGHIRFDVIAEGQVIFTIPVGVVVLEGDLITLR